MEYLLIFKRNQRDYLKHDKTKFLILFVLTCQTTLILVSLFCLPMKCPIKLIYGAYSIPLKYLILKMSPMYHFLLIQ